MASVRSQLGLFFLLSLAGMSCIGSAQQHPPEPAVNLGDTSFLDALGAPGFLIEEIADGDHSGKTVDAAGKPGTGSTDVNSITSLTHSVYLTHYRVLGAWYGFEVVMVAAHVNAGPGGNAGGVGDLTVSPLVLQWRQLKLGSTRLNQRFVLDSELPVGEYNSRAALNLSGHAFTVHPYYAFTFLPTKRIETSWRTSYLYNTVNNAPPGGVGVRSTQAGEAVHFNATAAYQLPHNLWTGANGYFLEQITDPKINGVSLPDSPERVGAIGPGALLDHGPYLFYINAYHEFGAQNRPEGNKLVFRVQWIPGRHRGIGAPN